MVENVTHNFHLFFTQIAECDKFRELVPNALILINLSKFWQLRCMQIYIQNSDFFLCKSYIKTFWAVGLNSKYLNGWKCILEMFENIYFITIS